jgi:hypothetical protein
LQPWAAVTGQRDSAGSLPHRDTTTTGWSPSCTCEAATVPCTVLDPFSGAGTALLVADRLGRDAIGIDLSHAYVEMTRERLTADCPLFMDIGISPPSQQVEIVDGEQDHSLIGLGRLIGCLAR